MGQRIHVLPLDDIIEHEDTGDDCPCGPTLELVPSEDGDGWLIIHHALDGREHDEPDHDRDGCPLCSARGA